MAQAEPIFYPVQRLINKTVFEGKTYYLVKWKGFNEAEATWERTDTLKYIKPLIRKFNQELRQKRHYQKNGKTNSRNKRLPKTASFGSKQKGTYERGKPLVGQILSNDLESNKNRKESINNRQKIQSRALKQQKPKIDKGNNDQFNFQQRKSMSYGNIIEDNNDASEARNGKDLIFKPLCIKFTGYSQKNRIMSKAFQFSSNRNDKKVQENQENNKQAHSLDTTLKEKQVNIDSKQAKSKLVPNDENSHKLKRMSLLTKSSVSCGLQYFIEEESGKLAIMSGSELLKLYPNDFLCYFEKMVIKNLS